MAKTKTSKLFERWYNKSGARLFDKIGRKRSKLWMREVYNSIRGEKNPKTGKNYTHRETINKIKNRREFLGAPDLGAINLFSNLYQMITPAEKRKFKGGKLFIYKNQTFIRRTNGDIYFLFMDSTAGSPTPNYMILNDDIRNNLYQEIAGGRNEFFKWLDENGVYIV